MSGRSPSVSVVVPVYNAAESLRELTERIAAVLHGQPHEIILVNDASPDDSWSTIRAIAQESNAVRGIDLARNFGQHNALLAGIRAARHEVVVTIDDDLQHPPEEIPKLLAELERGFDVVYGSQTKEAHGLLRSGASRLTKIALSQFMAAETARRVSAFRAFRTPVRDAFAGYDAPMVNIDVMLTWGTSRFSFVEVQHDARKYGQSNYTVGKLYTHAANMITGYSIRPLQISSMLGFGFTIFGIGVLGVVLVNYMLNGGQVPGFTFVASIVAIFAGIQLFALGIIGEYIARMHMRLMGRPDYVVRETVAGADGAPDDPE
ncbi:MAG TPA: glycosyltransferase family 2 protein [Acidimicrobiia bacterium]|nr:glycosyltransferase family 2 protein [Acidimicrobiia bacterium]